MVEFSKDVAPYLTPALVFVGWMVVNHQNNKRETRKEFRALVDTAKVEARTIAKLRLDDMLKGANDNALEITSGLTALEVNLERFDNFLPNTPLMSAYVAFSEALTGGDFQSAARTARPRNDPAIGAVLRTRDELFASLEQKFRAVYT